MGSTGSMRISLTGLKERWDAHSRCLLKGSVEIIAAVQVQIITIVTCTDNYLYLICKINGGGNLAGLEEKKKSTILKPVIFFAANKMAATKLRYILVWICKIDMMSKDVPKFRLLYVKNVKPGDSVIVDHEQDLESSN